MSKLDDVAKIQRPLNTAANRKSKEDEYDGGDVDALSDGDEYGKGETKSGVGGKTDITKRGEANSVNVFSKGKEYPPTD